MADASETQAGQEVPEQTVDQITKAPASPPEKVKDPKRVRAGKALAQKNKEAREAQAALSAKKKEEEKGFSDLFSNIQMAASLVGAGFVLWHVWQAASPLFKDVLEAKKEKKGSRHVTFEEGESEKEEKTKSPPPTHTQPQTPKEEESNLLMD